MKNLLIMIALFFAMGLQAQPPGGQGRQFDRDEMVKRQTKDMVENLSLNEDQTKKVSELNEKYAEKMGEIFQNANGDFSGMREKMGKLREEKNEELKTVLTEEQFKKYLELEEKRMEEMRQRRQNGGPGPGGERRGRPRGGGN